MDISLPPNSNAGNERHPLSDHEPASKRRGLKSSILKTIGDTPVVKLNQIGPDHVEIYAKLESFNPLGSVRDRAALGIIEAAEAKACLGNPCAP